MLGGSFLGLLAGVLSGYVPGLHPNTFFSEYDPGPVGRDDLLSFAVTASAINAPVSKLESMFLGVPDDQTTTAVLVPFQRYALAGRAEEAARLSALGTLSTALITAPLVLALSGVAPKVYGALRPAVPALVLAVIGVQAVDNGLDGLVVSGASAGVGCLALLWGSMNVPGPIESMLTGFYAVGPGLSCALNRPEIPGQGRARPRVSGVDLLRCGVLGTLTGVVLGLLPGLGPANVVSLLRRLGIRRADEYIMVVSGVDASDNLTSIVALYALGNPRSGASVFLQEHLGGMTWGEALEAAGLYAATLPVGTWLLVRSSRVFGAVLTGARAQVATVVVTLALLALSAGRGPGALGLCLVCSGIGIYALRRGVDPSVCSAALAVPTALRLAGVWG